MSDRSRYKRGDFEARNRQLPADRNVKGAKGRAWKKARTDAENTPLGAPKKPVDVRSVYDTRPVNAFDFNITSRQLFTAEVGFEGPAPFFLVPSGFICVLRELDIWTEPAAFENRSTLQVILTLNGGDVPYNGNDEDPTNPGVFDQGIYVGSASGRFPVFLIANEFNRVGVRFRSSSAPSQSSVNYVLFYGQFLLKSGLPPALEIGNPVPPKAPVPKRVEPPKPSAPPLPSAPSVNVRAVRAAPPWKIEITHARSGEASKNKAPLARLLVNQNGKQRLPTPQELIDYADLFEAAKRSQPINTRWY